MPSIFQYRNSQELPALTGLSADLSSVCLSSLSRTSAYAPNLPGCIPAAGSLLLHHDQPCAVCQDLLLFRVLRSSQGRRNLSLQFMPLMQQLGQGQQAAHVPLVWPQVTHCKKTILVLA